MRTMLAFYPNTTLQEGILQKFLPLLSTFTTTTHLSFPPIHPSEPHQSPTMPSTLSPPDFKPLSETILFTPLSLGAITLSHRIIQSPCTRMRGILESPGIWACGDLNVEYYAQRASKGGLQITEATSISRLVSFCSYFCF
jgi:hypothetical protein